MSYNQLQTIWYKLKHDVDLHDKISFQKSHFFLLQIIEWLINTAAYARESPAASVTHGFLRFELPTLNALDEAIVQGRQDNALRVELKMWILK